MNVIEVDQLAKKYRLGVYGGKTLRDDITAWWNRKRGKADDRIMIGDEARANAAGEFWALRDISFEVKQGEVLGIIGKNGAGKSTLLKLLSRITYPTQGEIRVRGRIASLLEVGTGFHPELTGRENIFLNGAILGMTRQEVAAKLDEIIAFSGIEHHIDTPVKRYSSGMKVRLGFAVAAHLEPEILIVDEVLAVGDAEFQRKCIGKMQDVAGKGRTVLFVSHNMASIRSLCSRAILIRNGRMVMDDNAEHVVNAYLSENLEGFSLKREWNSASAPERNGLRLVKAQFLSGNAEEEFIYLENENKMQIVFENDQPRELNVSIQLFTEDGQHVFTTGSGEMEVQSGKHTYTCVFPENFFNNLRYYVRLNIVHQQKVVFTVNEMLGFEVREADREKWFGSYKGVLRPKFKWEVENG